MERDPPQQRPAEKWVTERVEAKGLRPRFAASLIAAIWVVIMVAFGVAEHLVEPETFPNIWLGMWWALQTVTTVGYGDVVPDGTAGKMIGSLLMLGGLSLLAVVTGVVTSAFVTRAEAARAAREGDPVLRKLDEVTEGLNTALAELARLRADRE